MNECSSIQTGFSDYLDSRLSGREMQQMAAHLEVCAGCKREW